MMTLTKGSHVPPEAVRSAARRGLELRKKHGKGGLSTQEAGRQGIGSGVARASNLAAGDAVSTETLRRMVAFFSRHRKNKSGGEDDAGYIAWLLWGGDPGEAWAKRELAKVDRVEKGTGPLQPIIDVIEVHAPGWLELPRHYALSLGDGLAKGLSHRYIRRVPTGKTTKTGKPRYRYYYHAAHGGTVGNEDHYVVGASFKDDAGHWHITGREGDKLTLKHDETGEDRVMTTRELREHLVALHKEAIAGAQERARQDIADARASGATAKQVARLTERAARVGVTDPKDSGEGNGLKVTVTSGSKAGTYQLHQGSKKIASGPKHAMEAMGHWIREYGMNLTSNDRIAVVKPELQAAMSALGRMSSKFHGRLRESLEAGTHTQNPNAVQASVKMVEAASILGRYEDRNDPVFAATDADRKMFADRLAASGVSSVDAARVGAKVDPEVSRVVTPERVGKRRAPTTDEAAEARAAIRKMTPGASVKLTPSGDLLIQKTPGFKGSDTTAVLDYLKSNGWVFGQSGTPDSSEPRYRSTVGAGISLDAIRVQRDANDAPSVPAKPQESDVKFVRAPAGGATSDVDGKFYRGGQMMPIHGKFSGLGATALPGTGTASEDAGRASSPDETDRRRMYSEDDIRRARSDAEEKRALDEVKSGPLGRVLPAGVNQSASKPMQTGSREWASFVEGIGQDGLERVVSELEREYHALIDSNIPDAEAAQWEKQNRHEMASQYAPPRHEKRFPGSTYARSIVDAMLNTIGGPHAKGTAPIDAARMVNAAMSRAVAAGATPSSSPDRAAVLEQIRVIEHEIDPYGQNTIRPVRWSPMVVRDPKRYSELRAKIHALEETIGQRPWQRTKEAMGAADRMPEEKHREIVVRALAEGKAVPADVLAGHPGAAEEAASVTGGPKGDASQVKPAVKPRKFDELMQRTDALNAKLDAMTPVPSAPKLTTAATNFADDIPMSLAVSAHSGTSHVPERRGEQEREGYAAHLAHVRGQLAKYETPENREAVEQAFAEYRAGYASRYKAMLSAKSRVMSSMVTGPARFPTASNQKRGDVADSRTNDVVEWSAEQSKKLLKRFNPNVPGPISADRKDAVPAIESEVDKLKARQSMMVAANKVYRNKSLSDDEKVAKLVELGVSPTVARAQLKPDFAGRIGFPDYALVNNSANIRRLESRAESVATEQAKATTEHAFDGGRVVDDADANRVRIYHDAKPSTDVIAKLKSSGFKWSPSEGAWQRQRNNAARYAAGVITGAAIGKGILSPLINALGRL